MIRSLISNRRRLGVVSAAAASVLSISSPRFAAIGATFGAAWGNFATGNYATATNWSASSAPNDGVPTVNDFYNVTINRVAGATVAGNMSAEILNLTIGANNSLNLNVSQSLDLIGTATNGPATLSNAGTLSLATNAQLHLLGSSTTISGAGTIILGSGASIGGAGTVNTNNTIRGQGSLGLNQLALTNTGLIVADVSSEVLSIDPRSSSGMVNTGELRADNNGFLVLTGNGGGSFNNAGGVITAMNSANFQLDAGAFVLGGTINVQTTGSFDMFSNSTVSATTITTAGTGRVRVSGGNTGSFAGVANSGNIQIPAASTGIFTGTTLNNGSINVTSGVGAAVFSFGAGTTTMNGTGSVAVSGSVSDAAFVTGTGTLVNNGSFIGSAFVGQGTGVIRNNGTFLANVSNSGLEFQPTLTGIGGFNAGTLMATNNADLAFVNAAVWTNAGTVLASGTGFVDLARVTLNGGTVATVAGGRIQTTALRTATLAGVHVVIDPAGTLIIDGNSTLTINGSVNNAGNVNMDVGALSSRVNVASGSLQLTGGGTVRLSTLGAGTASIGGPGTLNNVNNLIHGQGFVGLNTAPIVNAGTITADAGAGLQLVIDPSTGNLANSGTMLASNGAVLVLDGNGGGFVANTGTISAANGTVLLQNGISISGGNVRSDPTGEVQVNGSSGGIAGVANSGAIDVSNGTLTLNSVINNSGTISVVEDANAATLSIIGVGATLTGGGQVRLGKSGTGTPNVVAANGGVVLTNTNNTIRGRGFLGRDSVQLSNAGTIVADQSGQTLVIDPATAVWTNTGTLTATGGGILELSGAGTQQTLFNTGGRAIAATGSNARINQLTISGGTLSSAGTGTVSVIAGPASTLDGVTNTGNLTIENGATLRIAAAGTLTNSGSINVGGTSSNTLFGAINGFDATLTGGGVVNLSGGSFTQVSGNLINVNNVIRGSGHILDRYSNGTTALLDANFAGQVLSITPAATLGPASVTNSGLARASNGGILEILGGGGFGGSIFDNGATGTILAANGSMVHLNGGSFGFGGVAVTGGTLLTSGTGSILIENTVGLGTITLAGNAFMANNATLSSGQSVNTGTITMLGVGTLSGATFTNAGLITGAIKLNGQNGSANPIFVMNNTGTIDAVGPLELISHSSNIPPVLNNAGTIHLLSGGGISGAGTITNSGLIHLLSGGSITGNTTFAGANGTLRVDAGATFGFLGTPADCGTLILDGQASNLGPMTASAITGSGTLLNMSFSIFGQTTVGSVTFQSSRVRNVVVTDGTLTTLANGGTLGTSRVTNLTMNPATARWNLNDNDLVVDFDVDSPLAAYRALLLSGRNGGAWNGPGLTSAAAAANVATGLGMMNSIDRFGLNGGVFSGQNVDATTLLIKYTWNGDTDLNGVVNFDDYVRTDVGFNVGLPGWNNGDFNYDGIVNFDDYVLIDIAFNVQSGTLGRAVAYLSGDDRSSSRLADPGIKVVADHFGQFGDAYAQHFLAAVPEPGTLGIMLLGGAVLRRKRALKSQQN